MINMHLCGLENLTMRLAACWEYLWPAEQAMSCWPACRSPAAPRPTSTSPTTWPSAFPSSPVRVLALSFLLVMTVFRPLLVPLKAVLVNMLSIGAPYGTSSPSSSGVERVVPGRLRDPLVRLAIAG